MSAKDIKENHANVALNALFTGFPKSFEAFVDVGCSLIEAFRPVVGGTEFPEQPMAMIQSGAWNKDKNVIIGDNSDEMSVFIEVFLQQVGKINVS